MSKRTRGIKTTKAYEIYVDFEKPTSEQTFRESSLYKEMIAFIKDNELILYDEYYQSLYDPEDGDYDPNEEPDFYRFTFLKKQHANEVSKKFSLPMREYDNGDEYMCWSPNDPERYGTLHDWLRNIQ